MGVGCLVCYALLLMGAVGLGAPVAAAMVAGVCAVGLVLVVLGLLALPALRLPCALVGLTLTPSSSLLLLPTTTRPYMHWGVHWLALVPCVAHATVSLPPIALAKWPPAQ